MNESRQRKNIRPILRGYFDLLRQIESFNCINHHQDFEQLVNELHEDEQEMHHQIITETMKISEKLRDLSWMSEHLTILHEFGQTFTKVFELGQIYEKTFELVSRVMPTDAFFIAFYEEDAQRIKIPFSIDSGKRFEEKVIPFGEGNISKVLQTKQTIHISTQNELVSSSPTRWGNPELDTSTAIFVPLLIGDKVKGVISVQSYHEYAYSKEHEELLRIIGIQVANAVETARLYEQLYQSSYRDEMTGLKNYRAFHEDLDKLFSLTDRNARLTLIMFDSDNLKCVNDRYGHHVGDLLISRLGEALQNHLEDGEQAYRYAGDEFMLLSTRMSRSEAQAKVEKIRHYLQEHPIEHGQRISVSVSVGIALAPNHATNSEDLKRAADKAMYNSKRSGKNKSTILD